MKSVNEEGKPDGDIHVSLQIPGANGGELRVMVMVEADR